LISTFLLVARFYQTPWPHTAPPKARLRLINRAFGIAPTLFACAKYQLFWGIFLQILKRYTN
jgi:hypothetical protein